MPDAVDRGVTVRETATVDQPIALLPESTAAFIGRALRGPLNIPIAVSSPAEFQLRFGGDADAVGLAAAVRDFFAQGGRRLSIVRVANNARGAMLCLPAAGSALILRAVEPGASERLRASVDFDGIDPGDEQRFNLTLQRLGPDRGPVRNRIVDQEIYRGLSFCDGADDFIGDALQGSGLVRLQAPWPRRRPEATLAPGNRFLPAWVDSVQAGSDGEPLSDYDLVGSRNDGTGLFALDALDELDFLYLPPHGESADLGPAALLAAEMYCRSRGAMLVVDPAASWRSSSDAVSGMRRLGYTSPNMLGCFPRVGFGMAPGAAVTGALCANDRVHGPWQDFSPTGLALRGRLKPDVELDEGAARRLARAGLNALYRDARQRVRLGGCRTFAESGAAPVEFRCLAVRRLALRIIAAVDRSTRRSVFRVQDATLLEETRLQLRDYLARLAAAGALADDFGVECSAPAGERGVLVDLAFRAAGHDAPIRLGLQQTAAGCRVCREPPAAGMA